MLQRHAFSFLKMSTSGYHYNELIVGAMKCGNPRASVQFVSVNCLSSE
jgi:hypothetical protein